jgi:hypothetical protein
MRVFRTRSGNVTVAHGAANCANSGVASEPPVRASTRYLTMRIACPQTLRSMSYHDSKGQRSGYSGGADRTGQGLAFIIENRSGAGGIIGAEAVSRSAPDGSTRMMDSHSSLIDALVQKTDYHPLTNFQPVCNLVDAPVAIPVNAAAPYGKADLIDAGQASRNNACHCRPPRAVNWQLEVHARGERGSFFLPYPALFSTVSEHLNAGRLRALATNFDAHRAAAAGVDGRGSGYSDYGLDVWIGPWLRRRHRRKLPDNSPCFTAAVQTLEIKHKLVVQALSSRRMCHGLSCLRWKYHEYGRASARQTSRQSEPARLRVKVSHHDPAADGPELL